MLSGIDEVFQDIPVCPTYKIRPLFWILNTGEKCDGWFWLFSNEYLKETDTLHRLEQTNAFKTSELNFTLDDVVNVVARYSDIRNYDSKLYSKESEIFKEVIKHARRCMPLCQVRNRRTTESI